MEGLPFKYVVILISAVLVLTAVILSTNMLSETARVATQNANTTLLDTLNKSLSNALNSTSP